MANDISQQKEPSTTNYLSYLRKTNPSDQILLQKNLPETITTNHSLSSSHSSHHLTKTSLFLSTLAAVGDFRLAYIYTLTGAGVDDHTINFSSSRSTDLDKIEVSIPRGAGVGTAHCSRLGPCNIGATFILLS